MADQSLSHPTQQQVEKRQQEKKQAADQRKKDADEALKANADARVKNSEAAVQRMEKTQPTPTQEENDRAKLGDPVEEKEPDGSPEQSMGGTGPVVQNKKSDAKSGGAPYQTRAAAPKP